MLCVHCGRPVHVRILEPGEEGWAEHAYCEHCHRTQPANPRRCGRCGTSFEAFLSRGLLGCENCYEALAPDLEPLMERYQGRPPGRSVGSRPYAPGRLARARSDEVVEMLSTDAAAVPALAAAPFTPGHPAASRKDCPLQSMRLRVARNIAGVPFFHRLSDAPRVALATILLSPGSPLTRWLSETLARRFHPVELRRQGEKRAAIAAGPDGPVVYCGDEDHVRLEWLFPVIDDEQSHRNLQNFLGLLPGLDSLFAWQYHGDYGFLTACPGIGGLGIRLSFEMHLPGLGAAGGRTRWEDRLLRAGFELRGADGEGSTGSDRLQISNRYWRSGGDPRAEFRRALFLMRRLEQAEYRARVAPAGSSLLVETTDT